MVIPPAETYFGVTPSVYVIESPSADDMAAGKSEAEALAPALRLASIPHELFAVEDRGEFRDALATIPEFIKNNRQAGRLVVPAIHLSAHGGQAGIQLKSKEVLDWIEIRLLLVDLARSAGLLTGRGRSLIELNVSTCFGGYAAQMFGLGLPYPCAGVIGPMSAIPWSDALVAWVTFHHQTRVKGAIAPDAVGMMNNAAGTDSFRTILPPDLASQISVGGAARARAYAELVRRDAAQGSQASS